MESTDFSYNGVSSTVMGLKLINFETGMLSTPYWGAANVQEVYAPKKLKSYLYRVNREPIEFKATFVLVDVNGLPVEWTAAERKRIASYFIFDSYKPFITNDDITKIYYAICTNAANLNLISGLGYLELEFRTNSPFAWTEETSTIFDLSSAPSITYVQYENKSNVGGFYYPKLEVDLESSITDFSIVNTSNANKTLSFTGLTVGEIVSIDNENKIVLSNTPMTNPFSKFNGIWLELVPGFNTLGITGRGIYTIKSQFPIAQ